MLDKAEKVMYNNIVKIKKTKKSNEEMKGKTKNV